MSKHKKNEQITFNDLTKSEKIALSLTYEALKRDDKHISVYIKGKSIDVSVHPWDPEREGHWTETEPGFFECSACRNTQIDKTDYCPDCGARMEDDGK